MLDRRQLLSAGASAAALVLAPGAQAAAGESARLTAMLDTFFQEGLERQPENATELGLDKGANAALKARLEDVSAAGMAAERAANLSVIRRLKTFDRRKLAGMDAVNYDTVLYVAQATQPLLDLDLGGRDGFSPSCYVLSPITGAYQRMPNFLDEKHSIATAADAEAYLARLDGFATALDQNTDRFRHDAGKGVVPPDFLLDITLGQLAALRTTGDKSDLVKSLDRRARAKGLGEAYGAKAAQLYDAKVGPALDRQIAALKQARPGAVHDAGVWRFKDGPAFYAANLKYTTTTDMTPQEVHKLGLDQAQEYGARLDVLLRKQGLTQGAVGQRIQQLYKDPSYYFPWPIPKARRSTARGPGSSISTSRTRPSGRSGTCPRPSITRACRAISCRAAWRRKARASRCCARTCTFRPTAKDGRSMPSNWPRNSACTRTIRWARSAGARRRYSAPAAAWSTPACTPCIGAASGRSNI